MSRPNVSDDTQAILEVVRCQLGERDAFTDLVHRWQSPLYGFVLRMASGEVVDDIVQTVWLKVVRGLPRLRDPAAFPAWMFSIARRCVVDRYRRDEAEVAIPVDEPPDVGFDDLDERLLSGAVAAAVDRLPDTAREAIHLHYLVDLSVADVAQVVGVPVGTVKSRLSRGRRLLAQMIDPPNEERTP